MAIFRDATQTHMKLDMIILDTASAYFIDYNVSARDLLKGWHVNM